MALLATLGFVVLTGSCADSSPADALASSRSAIIGGRPSSDAENMFVRIETPTQSATGVLVAPKVVIAAAHSVSLGEAPKGYTCLPSGEFVSGSAGETVDHRLHAASDVHVFLGTSVENARSVAAASIHGTGGTHWCRNDIVVIALAEPLADIHVPIRTTSVRRGERLMLSGWGMTSDDATRSPSYRTSRDDIKVETVGPGSIPAGMFSVAGGVICYGDSGAGALFEGVLGGIASKITGDSCELEVARGEFTMTAPHRALIERGFAAAGERPTFAEENVVDGGSSECSDGGSCEPQRLAVAGRGCSSAPRTRTSAPIGLATSILALLTRRRRVAHRRSSTHLDSWATPP